MNRKKIYNRFEKLMHWHNLSEEKKKKWIKESYEKYLSLDMDTLKSNDVLVEVMNIAMRDAFWETQSLDFAIRKPKGVRK